ncbi:MAG: CHAT domain-containing tetratricopeptide repeat protein, partial [Geitlerinemataceae cyanobacterium]
RLIRAALLVGVLYFYSPIDKMSGKTSLLEGNRLASFISERETIASDTSIAACQAFTEGMQQYGLGTPDGWRGAIEKWTEALQHWSDENNCTAKAVVLTFQGSAYTNLGELDRALEAYQQTLQLYREQNDRHSQVLTLRALAEVYTKLGQYQAAIDSTQDALSLCEEVCHDGGYRQVKADVLNTMGSIFAKLGDPEQALVRYEQALKIVKEVGNVQGEAATLNNMGNVEADLGNSQKALETYNLALPIAQKLSDRRREAATLNNIGFIYTQQQQYSQASETYQKALPLWQALGDRSGEASTLTNLGVAYAHLGDAEKALDSYNRALPLRQAVRDRRGEATTLYRLAQLERDRGNNADALTRIKAAIEILESLRTNVQSEELRTSFFASIQEQYEFYIDLLMQLHRQQPDAGYDAIALHAGERTRARALLEVLAESGTDIHQGINPRELRDKERRLQQQIAALAAQQVTLLSSTHTAEQAETIETELQSLFQELDIVRGELRIHSPNYAALTQPQPLTLEEIQKQVLDEDTMLLEYFLGEKRSYLWAVTNESITSYELPPKAEIEAAVGDFRRAITSPRQRTNLAAIEPKVTNLSQKILAPVAEKLGNKRLVVVADGALQYIPFAALSVSAEYQPLIFDREVVNLPSASTLAVLRSHIEQRDPPPKTIALIADPVFAKDDERLQDVFEPQGIVTASRPDNLLLASARDMGLAMPPVRLPGTEQEAEAILSLVPEPEKLQAFGFDANRQIATSPDLDRYRLLHFATHGFLNSTHPELSGLVLSLVDRQGNPQDGFLRLHDVYNLKLSADLVVLSACQTGLGKDIRGEGIIGLTRGFMYAGVPRLVVSLWSVDDRGTAALMSAFYQKMLQNNLTPAAALRQAQIELWQNPEWQSPYYWSAFGLQGEWRVMGNK